VCVCVVRAWFFLVYVCGVYVWCVNVSRACGASPRPSATRAVPAVDMLAERAQDGLSSTPRLLAARLLARLPAHSGLTGRERVPLIGGSVGMDGSASLLEEGMRAPVTAAGAGAATSGAEVGAASSSENGAAALPVGISSAGVLPLAFGAGETAAGAGAPHGMDSLMPFFLPDGGGSLSQLSVEGARAGGCLRGERAAGARAMDLSSIGAGATFDLTLGEEGDGEAAAVDGAAAGAEGGSGSWWRAAASAALDAASAFFDSMLSYAVDEVT